MSVFVSVLVSGAGDSLMMVVLVSFFSAGGFVTVVSFCSHALSNAKPAKMQIYFFMHPWTDNAAHLFKALVTDSSSSSFRSW